MRAGTGGWSSRSGGGSSGNSGWRSMTLSPLIGRGGRRRPSFNEVSRWIGSPKSCLRLRSCASFLQDAAALARRGTLRYPLDWGQRLKPEHVVEAEGAVAAEEAVVAEQAAGRVADDRVGARAGTLARRWVEDAVVAPQPRSGAGDRQPCPRDLVAGAVMERDFGGAFRAPRLRRRVDQVAQRVVTAVAEPQEQPRRQPRRPPAVALRLAAIGHYRIEDVRAEAAFSAVPAAAMAIAEQRVQPAVAVTAVGEIVDQLGVPVPAAQSRAEAAEVDRRRVVARQPPEAPARHLVALGIVDHYGDRQFALRRGHRRRQQEALPFARRQHRARQQIALAERLAEPGQVRIWPQLVAFHVHMGDAPPALVDNFIPRTHDVLSGAQLDLARPAKPRQVFADIDDAAGERADRTVDRRTHFFAHRMQAQRAGRDRAGMAVLHPQQHALFRRRRRQPGIALGGPGIGVVGAGQHAIARLALVAENVEGILDDIVPGGAGNVQEQLACEVAEAETGADIAAVDDERAGADR